MTKRSNLFVCVLLAVLLVCGMANAAVSAPISATIELSPAFLTSPGEVSVTVSVSNVTNEDLTKPVTLYDSTSAQVMDFGTDGQVLLKAGETYTWTGTCQVSQNMLDMGLISYACKYVKTGTDGQDMEQTLPVQAKLLKEPVATLLQVQRTITPQVAKPDQEGKVTYLVTNAGTVSLTDIAFKENDDIDGDTHNVAALPAGKSFKIEFPFKMGNKSLTSGATISYYSEESSEKQVYVVEDQQIICGNSSISAKLTSSSKGAVVNSVITLTLKLKNEGTVDFSDIRVTDPTLGDVFTNQQLAAGQELELTKEITLTDTSSYQFSITAVDATGSESVTATETLEITAVNPEDALNLTVTASADRTEAYGNPADVRFTLTVTNDSNVDAKKVVVSHGDVELATYETIASGETRTINRDTALSHSGLYQFNVTAQDPLENNVTFLSNELQIAVLPPTPPPATPTPVVETPTPAPFVPATYIPASDPSVGTVPKAIRSWVFPAMIVCLVLLVACLGLLAFATKSRADKKKQSDAAYDHLERARRRDYTTPSIDEREKAAKEQAASRRPRKELTDEQKEAQMANRRIVGEPRDEDPAWDFVNTTLRSDEEDLTDEAAFSAMNRGVFDDDLTDEATLDFGAGDQPAYADAYAQDYAQPETYADENDGYTDQLDSQYGYADQSESQYTYADQDSGYTADQYDDSYTSQDGQWDQYQQDNFYDDYSGQSSYEGSYDGYSEDYQEPVEDLQTAYYDPEESSYEPMDSADGEPAGRRRSRFRNDQ